MKERSILVLGAGIAGVQASLELAESGFFVYLLESSSSIGGRMARLDKTFPTNDCSICILAPRLVEAGRHQNIKILTLSHLLQLDGEAKRFSAKIKRMPRFVNEERCVGCGICAQKCPVNIPNPFNEGLNTRKAIYIEYPQAIPLAYTISAKHCLYLREGKCGVCKKVCPAAAVDFEQKEEEQTLDVGAVIVAVGGKLFEPSKKAEYGYSKYEGVMTSAELERMLSATGPTLGKIEGMEKVAFIQCVGSRDRRHNPYCSSVCCMYAIKQALLLREQAKADVAIFGMELRAFSKGFLQYYKRAEQEGVRFKRARPSHIQRGDGTLYLYYEEDGIKRETFDTVILSLGFLQQREELFQILDIPLNDYNFPSTLPFEVIRTKREGVFLAGVAEGPKDIPECVVQASAAAACCATLLKERRHPHYIEEERVSVGDEARIAVFICHCGKNIASYIDIQALKKFASSLPNVVYAEDTLFACSQDSQEKIKEVITERGVNRVVVSACTPRTHEPLFQQTLREAGLNPYLFEMANIRDQCSWVHQDQDALSKAKSILLASVKKAALLQRAEIQRIPVTKAALIIGAGPAGMGAALLLAEQGYKVFLVEKENELGGRARKIKYRWDKEDVQDYVKKMAQRVREHPLIELFLNSKVESFSGYVGNFRAQLSEGTLLSFGALIIATGAKEELPFGRYFYGEDARVIVQSELEELVAEGRLKAESVVMVQCVRADEVGYCSRYCCIEAVKNAIEVRKFGAEVYLLYKDMRTYGFHELYYERAREEGVNFVRTNIESLSVSLLDKKVEVRVYDEILRRELLVHADILVLSTRMVPDNAELASLLKLPLTKEGFFLEMHPKLRPIDAQDGIFLAGTCSAPMLMEEAIAQGFAAASGAAKLLSKDFVERGGIVAYIDEERCASCLFCTRVCPYGAPIIEEGRVRIEIAKCHGCGMCTSSCPAKALSLKNLESAHIDALLEGLLV